MELSKIVIGAMRFKNRKSAIETIRAAIDAGFNYIDTSPAYCHTSENENSESWVGEAVNYKDYRQRVMISAKCTVGNGGMQLGEFNQSIGFGARTKEEFNQMFNQSLKRQNLTSFDYYQLWTTHTVEQFNEAFKPGGWYDGLISQKSKWNTFGITSHAETSTLLEFLKTGKFRLLTIPLNVINRTRVGVLKFCSDNDIKVIAMNPLAGGFLASNERLKELALRYLISLENVHLLIGFSSVEEVEYAKYILDTTPAGGGNPDSYIAEVESLLNTNDPRCSSCGYCAPCPMGINLGACLSYYNMYKYLRMEDAREAFIEKQWEDGLRLDRCKECMICANKCPNALPLSRIIPDAKRSLYAFVKK